MGIDYRRGNIKGVEEMEVCGYPGDKEAHTMWNAFGSCTSDTETMLKYKIPTWPGQSGSPVIKREEGKEFVIGVHIGSNQNDTRNLAVRLTPQKRKIINEWVGQITGKLNLGKLVVI